MENKWRFGVRTCDSLVYFVSDLELQSWGAGLRGRGDRGFKLRHYGFEQTCCAFKPTSNYEVKTQASKSYISRSLLLRDSARVSLQILKC